MSQNAGLDGRGLPPGYPLRPDWEITPREAMAKLKAGGGFVLIDVRTDEERRVASVPGSVHIPLDRLEARLEEIETDGEVAFLCHHGVRSMKAAALARAKGLAGAVSVAGGIDLWSLAADPAVTRYERGSGGTVALGRTAPGS